MNSSFTRLTYTAAIISLIGFAAYTLGGQDRFSPLRTKREEIRKLEKRNAELAREIELRRQRIHRLQENPAQQELEIRRQMKLVRPGEKVFILQDQPANDPPGQPQP
jgi:cell division protein FtsB